MPSLIRKGLPSSRHPVGEFQAVMLAELVDALKTQACKKFKVTDLGECLPEQASKFTDLPAYEMFIQGTYTFRENVGHFRQLVFRKLTANPETEIDKGLESPAAGIVDGLGNRVIAVRPGCD